MHLQAARVNVNLHLLDVGTEPLGGHDDNTRNPTLTRHFVRLEDTRRAAEHRLVGRAAGSATFVTDQAVGNGSMICMKIVVSLFGVPGEVPGEVLLMHQ